MTDISSEAKKAGLQEPEKPVQDMTQVELGAFRASFDPDSMGFDGQEGIDAEYGQNGEGGSEDGSK